MGRDFLDAVNIISGEKQQLAEWDTNTHSVTDNRVLVSSKKAVALMPYNLQTKQFEFWDASSVKGAVNQPYLTNVYHSFIPTETGPGVYDLNKKALLDLSGEQKTLQAETLDDVMLA